MEQLSPYLFSYRHDASVWSFEVWASSPEDARARVSKMAYATYDGVLIAKLPARLGLLGRLITSVRNALTPAPPTSP